ncbi:hypothetical protein JMA43_00445 [Joostella sp. CR20]
MAQVACKNDDVQTTKLTTDADSLRLQQRKEKVLTDEQHIKNMLRKKNNQLQTKDSVFYTATIKRPVDSSFIVMNLYGKAKRQGKLQEFKKTAIIKDGKTITSEISGSVFRIDNVAKNQYKIYTHDASQHSYAAFDVDFDEEPVSIKKATKTANFYYNLLPKKTFTYSIDNKDKFFSIRKDKLVLNDTILDTLANGGKVYKSVALLDSQEAAGLNTYYFVDSVSVLEKLIIRDTARVLTNITLSGKRFDGVSTTNYSSAFVNDSIFQSYEVTEKQTKNSAHVVAYATDSVVRNYRYNKNFNFSLLNTNAYQSEQSYPQFYKALIDSTFYVYSKPFAMNKQELRWRYSVRYTRKTVANPMPIEVSVSKKELIKNVDSSFVFEAPLQPIKKPIKIETLSEQNYKVSDFDINFDGYTDFSFPEGFDLNQNATYAVYLYRPEKQTFIKNNTFTGPSMAPYILIDKDNKSAIYTSKIGNNNYSARIVKIGDDGKVLYKETYWSTQTGGKIKIHYQKSQGNAVVEKQNDIAKSKNWNAKDFKNEFLNWVKERTQ